MNQDLCWGKGLWWSWGLVHIWADLMWASWWEDCSTELNLYTRSTLSPLAPTYFLFRKTSHWAEIFAQKRDAHEFQLYYLHFRIFYQKFLLYVWMCTLCFSPLHTLNVNCCKIIHSVETAAQLLPSPPGPSHIPLQSGTALFLITVSYKAEEQGFHEWVISGNRITNYV